jgi:hypothetical protein
MRTEMNLMSVSGSTSHDRLGRRCVAILVVGAMAGLASCAGDDTKTPEVTRAPSAAASTAQTAVGGPVKIIVKGIRGRNPISPIDVRGNELGVGLFRAPVKNRWSWEGLGGSSVVVDDHGSVPAQYVRRPDPNWKQSKGPFPYVLPDVLTVPPGAYELYFWLSAGKLLPDVVHELAHNEPPPRWFPEPWGGPDDLEHTGVVGVCRAAFTVEGKLGATVRVWVPMFTHKTGFDFAMTCPTE